MQLCSKSMPSVHGCKASSKLSSKERYLLNKLVICGGSSAVSPGLQKADIWVQAVLAWHASAGM